MNPDSWDRVVVPSLFAAAAIDLAVIIGVVVWRAKTK